MPVTLWKCWDNPKVIRPTAHPTSKACPVEGANCKQSSCRSVFWRVGKRTFGFVRVENKRANDQSYFGYFLIIMAWFTNKNNVECEKQPEGQSKEHEYSAESIKNTAIYWLKKRQPASIHDKLLTLPAPLLLNSNLWSCVVLCFLLLPTKKIGGSVNKKTSSSSSSMRGFSICMSSMRSKAEMNGACLKASSRQPG